MMISAIELLHWLSEDTLSSIAEDLHTSLGYGAEMDQSIRDMLAAIDDVKACRECTP